MTRIEWAAVSAFLAASVAKPMPPEQVRAYYDLLADLPGEAVALAARQALLESRYPTVPPVGVLRQLATAGAQQPPAAEAYRLVLSVVNAPHRLRQQRLDALPPAARRAADAIGWAEIGNSDNPEVCRAQFTRAYEVYAEREQRERLLPRSLQEGLRQLAVRVGRALPAPGGAP